MVAKSTGQPINHHSISHSKSWTHSRSNTNGGFVFFSSHCWSSPPLSWLVSGLWSTLSSSAWHVDCSAFVFLDCWSAAGLVALVGQSNEPNRWMHSWEAMAWHFLDTFEFLPSLACRAWLFSSSWWPLRSAVFGFCLPSSLVWPFLTFLKLKNFLTRGGTGEQSTKRTTMSSLKVNFLSDTLALTQWVSLARAHTHTHKGFWQKIGWTQNFSLHFATKLCLIFAICQKFFTQNTHTQRQLARIRSAIQLNRRSNRSERVFWMSVRRRIRIRDAESISFAIDFNCNWLVAFPSTVLIWKKSVCVLWSVAKAFMDAHFFSFFSFSQLSSPPVAQLTNWTKKFVFCFLVAQCALHTRCPPPRPHISTHTANSNHTTGTGTDTHTDEPRRWMQFSSCALGSRRQSTQHLVTWIRQTNKGHLEWISFLIDCVFYLFVCVCTPGFVFNQFSLWFDRFGHVSLPFSRHHWISSLILFASADLSSNQIH